MTKTCALMICAAPLARRAADIASELLSRGWTVAPVATPTAGEDWVDHDLLATTTGVPVRSSYRSEAHQDDPVAILIVPATFNTLNKAAAGIADNYALSLLAEALGRGTPIAAVPFINVSLWRHPAFADTLKRLSDCGVHLLDPHQGRTATPLEHGSGAAIAESFDTKRLVDTWESWMGHSDGRI